jgi:hypothetical protein
LGQERFATGDVQCPQCREAAALGTVAGVFDRDLLASRVTVPIGQSLGTFGWRFDSLAQAAQPLAYYHRNNATNYQVPGGGVRPSGGRDSAAVSWANYGADYEVTYDFQNTSNRCVTVKGAFMVYPGTRDPSSVATLPRTMLWNGWALANGVPFQILVNPRRPDRAARTASPLPFACDARNRCTTTARVEANSTQTLRLRIPVPALISAPAGLVFQTAPCS